MTETDALQSTLEAEHAAVYVYAVLVGRGDTALAAPLWAAYREHRDRRDELTAMLRDTGQEPVAAAPAYELPARLDTPARVRRAAVAAERAGAEAYAALVAAATGELRSWGVSALTASAVRELTLGAAPTAFPGAPELV